MTKEYKLFRLYRILTESHLPERTASTPGYSTANRYLFGDKEYTDYDGESQLDFGARHLAPSVIPRFTTMDPLCEERPDESPYIFAAANPVMNIDPDGRKTYAVDSVGYITKLTDDKEFDTIIIKKSDGSEAMWKGDYGTIKDAYHLRYTASRKNICDYFEIKGDKKGKEIFEFLAENFSAKFSPIEWGLYQTGKSDKDGINYVGNGYSPETNPFDPNLFNYVLKPDKIKIRNHYHSHPDNVPYPSKSEKGTKGDIPFAKQLSRISQRKINYKIYLPDDRKYITYGPHSLQCEFLIPVKR